MKIVSAEHAYPKDKAIKLAAQLNEGDEDWTYVVIENPDPDGPKTAIVKAYDEEGVYVATM